MNKILIIGPPVHHYADRLSTRTIPPPAVYLLYTILREKGYEVDIIDPSEIRKVQPNEYTSQGIGEVLIPKINNVDVVLISSNTANWPMAKFIIHELKKINPEIVIVLGGVHSNYFDEYIINTTQVDFILRGEGEYAVLELLNALENNKDLSEIKGLTWRSKKEIIRNSDRPWLNSNQLNEIPIINYDLLPENVYYTLPFETSRGCRFSCRFCSVPRRNNWHGYCHSWIKDNLTQAVNRYGSKFINNDIYIVDDCFTADIDRAKNIFKSLNETNLSHKYIIEARATDIMQPGLTEVIHKDIVRRLAIGVECGYDEGLKKVGKGLTISQLEQCLEKLRKSDLMEFTYFSFIIGFPWETEEDCLKTIHFAASLVSRYGAVVNLNWLILLPSKLWFEREQYGINLSPEIFDDPFYMYGDKYFPHTHPSISRESILRIESVINNYERNGTFLRSG